ncbi:hypothetical protein D3C85_1642440 [compost metagenome]
MNHYKYTCVQVIGLFVRLFLYFLVCVLTVTLVAADEPQGNDSQGSEKWLEPARFKLMHVNGGIPSATKG